MVLMDVHMPEKNGVQATAEIRELEKDQSHVPIIGLTASILANERQIYLDAGMDDLLVKPISPEGLLETIRYWCSPKATHAEDAATQRRAASPAAAALPTTSTLEGQGDLARTLFEMLIAELPATRHNLQQAYTEKDWNRLRELVHKLLGGISYCNVPALKAAVENLQNQLHPVSETLPKALENVFNEMGWLENKYRDSHAAS
jgi:CheY-like chemotaxis protein